jgi:hypothetical protein
MGHVYRSKYTGHVIEMPHIPVEKAAKYLDWATYSTFKYLVDGIKWGQRCSTVRHPMITTGPSILHERSCRFLGMGCIVR